MATKQLTLCLIQQHEQILLGMKKRGFGEGRWNGFGGKVSPGESIENAAKREVLEECGITVTDLEKRGIVEFRFESNQEEVLEVHIFKARTFEGEPEESEEMRPAWFSIESIPFESMWPDDVHWMPLFIAEKLFKGEFLFGENDVIREHSLEEVSAL